jgi:hypothetical protein
MNRRREIFGLVVMVIILRIRIGLLPSENSPVGEQRARGFYLSVILAQAQDL